LAVRNVSIVDASRCQSQIFNLTAARTRLSNDTAFTTLCFIRNLSDGPASKPVPEASNFGISVNRKHRRSTRAPSQQTASGCTSTNLANGLRDRSTPSPTFSQHAGDCGKPQRLSQVTPIQPINRLPIVRSWPHKAMEQPMTDDMKHNEPVGYKRPPVATQFKPGVSGNPSGRPKTVRTLQTELLDELREVVRFREGDSDLEISKARAIAKSLVQAAAGGNLRATIALLTFFTKSLGDTDEPQAQEVAPEDAEIINAYESRKLRGRSNTYDTDADNSPMTSHEKGNSDNED
jgi:hypothetical protein